MSKIIIGNNEFNTLVAITEEEHTAGLMYIPPPTPIMCFPYKEAKERKFWMLNTISPLDIVFCNDNNVIGVYDGVPGSLALVGSDDPTNLVIEVPKGYAKKYSIKEGTKVKLIYNMECLAKLFEVNYLKLGNIAV